MYYTRFVVFCVTIYTIQVIMIMLFKFPTKANQPSKLDIQT